MKISALPAGSALGGTEAIPVVQSGATVQVTATQVKTFATVGFAPLASPAFTGTPTAPTAVPGTNTTQIATTAFVAASFAPLASPALTGTPTAPTAGGGTNTTQVATTAFVQSAISGFAPLVSPAFTGTPTAPTATAGTNTTQIATTAFVTGTFAPLASPALTGTPTAPTAGGGTNTTQIATTAFVQNAVTTGIASAAAVMGAAKNLVCSATGTDAYVSITADEIVLKNNSGLYITKSSVSLTINLGTLLDNGVDSSGTYSGGGAAASTWYAIYVIWNGSTLISLASTGAPRPAGGSYSAQYCARVGWIRTDATGGGGAYAMGFKQYGRNVQYVVASGSNVATAPLVVFGSSGTITSASTWTPTAVSISTYVPTTAGRIRGYISDGTSATGFLVAVAPNGSYTGVLGASPPPVVAQTGYFHGIQFDFAIESTNIYYASSATQPKVFCLGWEDNL